MRNVDNNGDYKYNSNKSDQTITSDIPNNLYIIHIN